jgi:hypothetical protein
MHEFPTQRPARPASLLRPDIGQETARETKSVSGRTARRDARASAGSDERLPTVPTRIACRMVRQLVLEMTALSNERTLRRRDSRRSTCHIRQIAMYVCHVVLQISLSDIGIAFGRDRTTVGHACNVVEDRRDDPAFDEFVASAERIVLSVFGPAGLGCHE